MKVFLSFLFSIIYFKKLQLKQPVVDWASFNISTPWDFQIASIFGVSASELSKNFKDDPALHSSISGACGMIRD